MKTVQLTMAVWADIRFTIAFVDLRTAVSTLMGVAVVVYVLNGATSWPHALVGGALAYLVWDYFWMQLVVLRVRVHVVEQRKLIDTQRELITQYKGIAAARQAHAQHAKGRFKL